MNIILIIGRLAFVAIFVLSGAQKLMDIGATAAMIGPKIAVPQELASFAAQLEGATGMTTPQLMAIAAGVVELAGGLMIAANIGTRVAALALVIFTAATTYWFHNFFLDVDAGMRMNNMAHALKNLSIIGALIVFFVIGPWRPDDNEPAEPHM